MDIKPGYLTSEFAVMVSIWVLAFLIVFLGIPISGVQDSLGKAIETVGAILSVVASFWKYTDSRVQVKTQIK